MTSSEFAQKLEKLTPSKESFLKLGYSSDMVNKRLSEYKCIGKEYIPQSYLNDDLLRLLTSYDCSAIQIGVVSFAKKIQEEENFYILGDVEADILALSKITLEVQVLDHENIDWVIWTCAANGGYFLDAMLCAAEFFSIRIKNTELANDINFTYENVLKCATKAGGEKYIDFYKMLLGYDE